MTLAIAHRGDEILLGLKKRDFGKGRWNGFGGKLEPGEDIETALRREVKEESGMVLKKFDKRGIFKFIFENEPQTLEVHLYKILEYEGEPSESEEMLPRWFSVSEIPFDQMWPDDIYWMPLFLADKKIKAEFFLKDKNTLLNKTIEEVEVL